MKSRPSTFFAFAFAFGICGCQIIAGYGSFSADSNADGGSPRRTPPREAGATCTTAKPPMLANGATYKGSALVPTTLPGGRCAWIDTTEVPQSDYQAFLAANPNPVIANDAPCGWKVTPDAGVNPYAPSVACIATASSNFAYGSSDQSLPQVCVDACDAAAFCQWAGKTLCQGSTASFPAVSSDNPWFAACSPSGALQAYAYGGTAYASGKCNAAQTCPCHFDDVGSTNACVSSNAAKNQSGNVAELSNDCDRSQDMNDECLVYGGSLGSSPQGLACGNPIIQKRGAVSDVVGFRCCVD